MSRLAGAVDPATPRRYELPPDPNAAEHRRQLAEEFGFSLPKPEPEPSQPKKTTAERAADFIEDIEWLLSQGEGFAGICQRLDRSAGAIERRLAKWGRHDLAQIFRRYH